MKFLVNLPQKQKPNETTITRKGTKQFIFSI